jgi:hypothetical protein
LNWTTADFACQSHFGTWGLFSNDPVQRPPRLRTRLCRLDQMLQDLQSEPEDRELPDRIDTPKRDIVPYLEKALRRVRPGAPAMERRVG